jgi:hypothetical protein
VSQETGRKTLYQLVRRWVEERGSAHHSRSIGKASSRQASSRQGFGLIGGAAPPDAEISLQSQPRHRRRVFATCDTVALAGPSAAFVPRLIEQSQCKPKRRPPQ